jgi:16S rRNA G966 N2-methylase RsmD
LVNNFDLSEVSFLDLFAGTGAISFEMASRGSNHIILVENFEGCINFIKKTIAELKTSAIKVQRTDVYKYLETCNETFDIIFADAPYKIPNLNKLPDIILEKKLLKEWSQRLWPCSIQTIFIRLALTAQCPFSSIVTFYIYQV